MNEYLNSRRLSRRDLLKLGGVAGLSLLVGTNSTKSVEQAVVVPDAEPRFSDFVEGTSKIENPTLRASSVLVYSPFGYGHGGLFADGDDYYLTTIQHVTFSIIGNFNCVVPGIDSGPREIHDPIWEYVGKESDSSFDPNMRHKLDPGFAREIKSLAAKGGINPLETVTDVSNVRVGDSFLFPLPNVGQTGRMKYAGYNDEYDLMVFEGEEGYICGGFSGLPVLEVGADGKMTNRSVGLIRGVSKEEANGCSTNKYFVKPHFPRS